jgi:hypothetical protein
MCQKCGAVSAFGSDRDVYNVTPLTTDCSFTRRSNEIYCRYRLSIFIFLFSYFHSLSGFFWGEEQIIGATTALSAHMPTPLI